MNSTNKISVEVPLEHNVYEITYEGQEIHQAPLTMSENLTKLAQKIDFCGKDETTGGDSADTKESSGETEGPAEGSFKTTPNWPWESVRNKLRTALTELSVLSDILAISQQRKYLVLDPVQAEPSEPKPAATLINKKKSIAAAAAVLNSGYDRLKTALNEAKSKSVTSQEDFYIELLRLRQNWRLRKVGNAILGDVSYRTAGSRFPQTGTFEITKSEDDSETNEPTEEGSTSNKSALRVTVPNELQGIAYIQVIIQEEANNLSFANIGLPSPVPVNAHWQQQLEAAQNVLFCKELFSVLAREAVSLSTMPIPPMVVGNQITTTLFPGTRLIIALCHSINEKANENSANAKMDQNHVLEHSLHQLLREIHRSNSSIASPHPASAPVGIPRKRRLAGPAAADRYSLLEMSKKEGMLEEIIKQSQHVVLRMRTKEVLDTLAKEIKDPLIVIHWASLNAVAHSSVRITLQSSGYDMCTRTHMLIHVKEKTLKCILRDGKSLNLSYELDELKDVVLTQIAIHQSMALQSLVKCMGLHVMASSCHIGIGECESIGNAASCLIATPSGKRHIAVRSSPSHHHQAGIKVYLGFPSTSKANWSDDKMEIDDSESAPLESFEAESAGFIYKQIKWEKLEGKNFLNKMEMLMAVLSDVE